jgi:hypothetical protein
MPTKQVRATALAQIEPDVLYPLAELEQRSGLGKAAMRTARGNGLSVLYTGGRAFVYGRDFHEYVRKNAKRKR